MRSASASDVVHRICGGDIDLDKLASSIARQSDLGGVVFVCADSTFQESIEEGVFGLTSSSKGLVERIAPGTLCFLYNLSSQRLHGVFEAVSKGGINLDPKAFSSFGASASDSKDEGHGNGESSPFPAQCKVRSVSADLAIDLGRWRSLKEFETFPGDKKFSLALSAKQAVALVAEMLTDSASVTSQEGQRGEEWEVVGKKKASAKGSSVSDSVGSADEGKRRRRDGSARVNGQKSNRTSQKSDSPKHSAAAPQHSSENANNMEDLEDQESRTRSEPSGWAAIVTGRLSPSELSATAPAPPATVEPVSLTMENLRVSDDVEDADTTSSDEKSPERSYGSDGAPSPHSAQEDQLINGARENASVVGAGAKALRGWASILGGSSAPQASEAVAKRGGTETATEDGDNQSDQVEASVPSKSSSDGAPSQPAWGGWAVRNPPPKVDLKATMEADAAAAAAAPPSVAKKEKQEEKQQGKNGKKAKDNKNKDAKKDVKQQRQDGNRKDKPMRTTINVPKAPFTKPTEVSGDRSRAPLSPELEAKLVEKLGRELLDCAHVQYFTPTAYLLKKERRAVDVVVRAMTAIAQTLFPSTGLEVFGSYPTRAWVPGSSNLDLSMSLPESVSSHPERRLEALNTLAMALRTNPWVLDVSVVPSAQRPLIRMMTHTAFFQPMSQHLSKKAYDAFTTAVAAVVPPGDGATTNGTPPLPPGPRPGAPYGVPGLGHPNGLGLPLEVHISLKDANHKGVAALRFIQGAEQANGVLAPIVCVQKAVLASKGLRGVYKGGVGSYALTIMALASVQRSNWLSRNETAESSDDSAAQVSTTEKNEDAKKADIEVADARDAAALGRAMLEFLKMYGYETDLTKDVIAAHAGNESEAWGVLAESSKMAAPLGSGLRVEDPLDASNNAGSGCFGISGVQAVFKEQLETLIKAAESNFSSNVPLLMQLIMLGGQHKVFVV